MTPLEQPHSATTVATLLTKRMSSDTQQNHHTITNLLEKIENGILRLHQQLFACAQRIDNAAIQTLVDHITADRRDLEMFCIHRVDTENPELSINHDLTNNDGTLSLYAQLAIAMRYDCRDRLLFLYTLQREICSRLEELGIPISQN
ncbi:MAG: hypothetical protein WCX61_00935 [Candidatus Peribacteraceae bacterium]|jgi:hypothetical protein